MFGQVIGNASQIIEGHFNEITKRENELHDKRIAICKKCPLYSDTVVGGMCDSKKCIDKETSAISTIPDHNSVCGCGCRLDAKTRLQYAKCVLNNW